MKGHFGKSGKFVKLAAGKAKLLAGVAGAGVAGVGAIGGIGTGQSGASAAAAAIPAIYLPMFQQAGQQYNIDWTVLAALADAESSFRPGALGPAVNGAAPDGWCGGKAVGMMQFSDPDVPQNAGTCGPNTFAEYAPSATASPFDAQDSIDAAANYLNSLGFATDPNGALMQYTGGNPGEVQQVLAQATSYAAPASPVTGGTSANNPVAQIALAAAQSELGMPYVWGGASPSAGGFDCQGLVRWAYSIAGVSIPGGSNTQFHAGPSVPFPSPGDLVFFGVPGSDFAGHVGMYMGNDEMIAADGGPHTSGEVQVTTVEPVYGWGWDAPDGDYYIGATSPSSGG